jgi:hypothetical protein
VPLHQQGWRLQPTRFLLGQELPTMRWVAQTIVSLAVIQREYSALAMLLLPPPKPTHCRLVNLPVQAPIPILLALADPFALEMELDSVRLQSYETLLILAPQDFYFFFKGRLSHMAQENITTK